jgi:hypothetical protein
MEKTTIQYFKWEDIKLAICQEMGIDPIYFRDYHKIVGGEYKDLWHEWMEYFDDVKNDTIVYNDLGESLESKIEWILEDEKEWLKPFVIAVYNVWDKYEIEYVKYSW